MPIQPGESGGPTQPGGLGPPSGGSGSGGSGGQVPPNPFPGNNYIEIDPGLGASTSNGEAGSSVITDENPGDLGSLFMNSNKYLLLMESMRRNSTFSGLVPTNHRYRGHREAVKFNLSIQKILTICSSLFLQLRSTNNTLETRELNSMYPTDTEIQNVNHCLQQIKFKEWLLMKNEDQMWFT